MDIIDTRELAKRLDELQDLKTTLEDAREALTSARQDLQAWQESAKGDKDTPEALEEDKTLAEALSDAEAAVEAAQEEFGPDEVAELAELEELESEISDFRHGEVMVPEGDFEDYARELAEDTGALEGADKWPLNCIDWRQAARELAHDYTTVSWQGQDYLVRA